MDKLLYNGFGDAMKTVHISAKEIAELLYGSGNITSDRLLLARAEEGNEIHKFWQSQYLTTDQKEVMVSAEYRADDFLVDISGRIDGIITLDGDIILEEIKSTRLDLESIDELTSPAHLAQAKLYAYMYCFANNLTKIIVRLTYIAVENHEVKTIDKNLTFKTLEKYFIKTLNTYLEWIKTIDYHEEARLKSIVGLTFPFSDFRDNQRELMGHVYRAIMEKNILYAIAPTGIGKTIAVLFSGLKTINMPRQKLFYLTAKNDGKRIALDTISILEEHGLIAKTCEITAKDSMCLLKERDCDPEVCKYAKGYYNRIYKAIDDIFRNESLLKKETIIAYGKRHRVCPFEYSLDLSNYCDIIIADYNYAFDPRAHLIRYFEDTTYEPILLVDEAHNLVSRSREMYSATLTNELFTTLLALTKGMKPNPKTEINRILDYFHEVEIDLLEVDFVRKEQVNDFLLLMLKKLLKKFDQAFLDEKKISNKSLITPLYFDIYQFVKIYEFFNNQFVYLLERDQNLLSVSIKCLNASEYILDIAKHKSRAAIFFSATLDPIFYYKTLLTQGIGKDIKMLSSFPPDNLMLIAIDDVSTRYNDRESSIDKIIETIETLVDGKPGNYIAFFPSYVYLSQVKDNLDLDPDEFEIITQKRDMSLRERQGTIDLFKQTSNKTQLGLFVMGGVFGESIDLIGDQLSGVVIVGVGLPMIAPFNNILKSHFDEAFSSGFDFAYTYPGLNKVIQAVGRVIRSETDRGIAILIDDRFTSRKYQQLFPKEWSHMETINNNQTLAKKIEQFWRKSQE
jgi:DNA excision repair protein ERCC-2